MKRKGMVLLGIALCAVLCVALFVGCNKKEGKKTILPKTEIAVDSAEKLAEIANYLGEEYSLYEFKLTDDIDLSGIDWVPIGLSLSHAFFGTLDGDDHTITGLTIQGWDENGAPRKDIGKQVIGWLDDGTPVYKSDEVVAVEKGEEIADGVFAVTSVVREGDDLDPKYQKLADGKGTFETDASYGSVGLFGYTRGAKIKNLTIEGADISFYTTGEYTYAGVVSGYDVASDFDDVHVSDSSIQVSNTYKNQSVLTYNDKTGTPSKFKATGVAKEYVGGVVGYAKGKAYLSEEGVPTQKQTVFKDVTSEQFTFGNVNYAAYYNANLEVEGGRLIVDTREEAGYTVEKVIRSRTSVTNLAIAKFPVQLYGGGVAGCVSGAKFKDVEVNGFNQATKSTDGSNKLSDVTTLFARSMYVGGAVGGMYSSTVEGLTINDAFVNAAFWTDWYHGEGVALVYDKATIGGAIAEAVESTVKNGEVNGLYSEVLGVSVNNVCIGGFVGYADGQTMVDDVDVNGMYAFSSYSGSEGDDLGSILSGAVGVLRNSSLKNANVSDVKFEISGYTPSNYVFSRCIVSQAYGNSVLKDSTATNVKIYESRTATYDGDHNVLVPQQFKNNVVNEDGYTSIKLYYSPDGERYDDTYVTVFGNTVPRDANDNLLHKEDVYVEVDLSGEYNVGEEIAYDQYYFYDAAKATYKLIWSETLAENRKFVEGRLYARKTAVYRVEFAEKNADATLAADTFYEYKESEAKLTLTTDTKPAKGKTYYAYIDDAIVSAYYLDVKVYSESGNLIVVDQKNVHNEDDDVTAEARYSLTKEQVDTAVKTALSGTTEYALAESEIYKDVYFTVGTGFKADINGLTIRYYDSATWNRDFSKYIFVSGRPAVDEASLEYVIK